MLGLYHARLTASTLYQFSPGQLLIWGLTIFLGIGVGLLIAMGDWFYALVLALLAPIAVLLISRPFVGIILWLLLMPFSSVLPNGEMIYWAIHRILVPLTLFLTIISRRHKMSKFPPVRLGLPELATGILVGLVPITIIYFQTDTRLPLIRYADRMLTPFCMYLVVRLMTLNNRYLQWLYWTAFFIAISQSVIGLLSSFVPQLLPSELHPYYATRASGSLGNPNAYAAVLVFCATLLFQNVMNRKPGLVRSAFLAACGLSAISGFLSMERAVWLGGACVILGLLVLYPKYMLRLSLIGMIFILALGGGLLSRQIAAARKRIDQRQQIFERIVIFDAMNQMVQIKPMLGWGYETLNQNIVKYYRPVGAAVIQGNRLLTSHNTYMTLLTELGLVELVLYLFPALWWLMGTVQAWRKIPEEGLWSRSLLAALWLGALFSFIVSNFMDMRFFPIALTLWWMTLGLVANLVSPYRRNLHTREVGCLCE